MNKKINNIPQLRFPEFDGDWEVKKLSDLVDRVTTKNKENNLNVCTISAQYGLISQLEYFNKSVSAKNITGYYLLNKNDFAYNKSYSKGYPMGAIKRLTRYEKGVVSTLYICFRNKSELDNAFAEQYYETGNQNKEIHKVAQEGARNHGLLNIGLNDFFSIPIPFPNLKEQKKIAHFFTILDKKITQLKQKKSSLEAYKKGVMQQIFSQELRFKDENGKAFPDWEVKKLGEVATITTGSSNRQDSGLDGEYTFFDRSVDIRTSKIFLFDGEAIIIAGEGSDFVPKYFVGKFDLHQRTYAIMNFINSNALYLYYYIGYNRRYFLRQAVGSTVKSLRLPMFVKMPIECPTLAEQTKIANFLSKIDEKIANVNQQIAQTKEWKKGLLQKMFVN